MTGINWHALNWIDYTILGIIILSALISFFRGFIREAISLTVWIIAFIVALKFSDALGHYFQSWIGSPFLRYCLAFILIFILILIAGALVNKLIYLAIEKIGLSIADRLLGIFFGVARGLLIVAVLLMFFETGTAINNQDLIRSQLAPSFKPVVAWLNGFLPQYMKSFSIWFKENKNNITINKGNP